MNTPRKIENLLQLLQKNSSQPMQNSRLIKRYISQAVTRGTPITFFDWECPPRKTDKTPNGEIFINYNVDLKKIFRGEQIDQFTELPRAVELRCEELEIIELLNKSGIPYRFVKLIADTNAYYLTPESLSRYGEISIRSKYREFKDLLTKKIGDYPARTQVYLYSELMRPYQKVYDAAFQKALKALTKNPARLLPVSIVEEQYKHIGGHLGMTEAESIRNISLRTIASYAAEGVVFLKLSQENNFSNGIWLNLREVDKRTVAITNSLRKANPLPMWYPIENHQHDH